MSQAATTDDRNERAEAARRTAGAAVDAWRRNVEVGAEAARAFHQEHAQFAGRLLDLNLQAARSFASPDAEERVTPLQLGASAVELYLNYLGRSAALAQQAIILPWANARARS